MTNVNVKLTLENIPTYAAFSAEFIS